MARFRDFDAERAEPDGRKKEPVEFKLGGEMFTTLPEAPAGAILDLVAAVQLTERGDRIYSMPNLTRFLLAVLQDEREVDAAEAVELGFTVEDGDEGPFMVPADDAQRMQLLLQDKRRLVSIEEFGEVTLWVAEELGARPTGQPARSARGRR